MAIFSVTYPAYQVTTVTTSATGIYNTYTYTPAGGSAVTFPQAGVTLRDITLRNTGSVTCFIQSASGTTGGLALAAGQQLTIEGWTATTAGTSTYVLYAYTASGSTTVEASLATVPQVV